MSANLALTKIKLGDSATPANNFLISVPDIADGTLTIEREDGTVVATIDAAGLIVGNIVGGLKLETAKTASGTGIGFLGIPSWAKRITFLLDGVGTNGNSQYIIRLGSAAGYETTAYASTACAMQSSTSYGAADATSGIVLQPSSFASSGLTWLGAITFTKLTGNEWVASGAISRDAGATGVSISGSKTLTGGVLDRIQLTTANGIAIFTSGYVNILYEG